MGLSLSPIVRAASHSAAGVDLEKRLYFICSFVQYKNI